MDPVIKEGASVWDLLAEDVASLDPVTKNADVASLDPSGSKVRFSVRVRLLHLSNHLNRGELAEKAAIGDAEKSTSGDVDKGTRRCGAPLRWCACKVQCRGCRQCECADCIKFINQDM